MNTFYYKGCYVHENFATGEVKVQFPDFRIVRVKSVHAAKLLISAESR